MISLNNYRGVTQGIYRPNLTRRFMEVCYLLTYNDPNLLGIQIHEAL